MSHQCGASGSTSGEEKGLKIKLHTPTSRGWEDENEGQLVKKVGKQQPARRGEGMPHLGSQGKENVLKSRQ